MMLLSVAGVIASTGVIPAGMPFPVMMVIAMKVAAYFQISFSKGFCHLIHISFRAADDLDTGIGKSIDGSASDTAANKKLDTFFL